MKYRVIWDPDAFRRLVGGWVAADKPEPAIRAFDTIEAILSVDAESNGESRSNDRRILIVPPLAVIFRAEPERREVLILDAWLFRERKK